MTSKRYDDVANDEPGVAQRPVRDCHAPWRAAPCPEFGPDGAQRPPREHGDDDMDDDGIPNDFDAVNNDAIPDDTSRKELHFDGRRPVRSEARSRAPTRPPSSSTRTSGGSSA